MSDRQGPNHSSNHDFLPMGKSKSRPELPQCGFTGFGTAEAGYGHHRGHQPPAPGTSPMAAARPEHRAARADTALNRTLPAALRRAFTRVFAVMNRGLIPNPCARQTQTQAWRFNTLR